MNDESRKLEDKVSKWLKNQGYPLEMEVAAEFQKNGFSVQQSSYFKDPETGKSREIDVVASKGIYTGETFAVIRFVIECKLSKDKPWIVFTRDNEIIDYEYSHWYTTNQLGWDYMLHASIEGKLDQHKLNHHKQKRIGYSITQAFTSGEDVTFKALNGVGNCAAAYIKKADSKQYDVLEIVIPVIIIEGKILEAELQERELKITSAEQSIVQWNTFIGEEEGFAVHILTQKALSSFVRKAKDTAESLCMDWENNLDKVLKEIEEIKSS